LVRLTPLLIFHHLSNEKTILLLKKKIIFPYILIKTHTNKFFLINFFCIKTFLIFFLNSTQKNVKPDDSKCLSLQLTRYSLSSHCGNRFLFSFLISLPLSSDQIAFVVVIVVGFAGLLCLIGEKVSENERKF
jgi:hypothetical protein